MAKKLLIDSFGIIRPILSEDSNGHMMMRGEFGRADIPTENRRIYPRTIWEREIQKIQQAITEGKVLGELDHPADGKTSLKRVSHVMTKLEMMEDGQIMGEARIADNDYGKQLKSIIAAGGSVGVSSRGMGSTSMNEDGYEVVQDDYAYMTHDCVADPAVKTSYPEFTKDSKSSNLSMTASASSEKQNLNKETVMETKVESKQEETKPVVETSTKADAPVVTEEKKVEEKKVEVPVALTEAQVTEKLETQKKELEEAHKKEVEALKADPKMLAGKLVLEDIAKLLTPVLLPEDVQAVVVAKDKEISDLKVVVESKDKAFAELTEKTMKATKVAHDIGMLLHFEKSLGEGSEREAVRKLVGNANKFKTHEELTEAIEGAKAALKSLSEDKSGIVAKEKQLREEYEAKIVEKDNELKKTKEALTEAAGLAKQFGLKAYILERVKGNPNGSKIIKLAEDVKSKAEADALIEKFSVDAGSSQGYNSIRNRFRKVENTSLVEEHLKDTGLDKKPAASNVVAEGVEGEMKDLFPGVSPEQVKDLAGIN